ncbi:MAG TPA: diguanylate cyclase [Polyangiaceae bacterium]
MASRPSQPPRPTSGEPRILVVDRDAATREQLETLARDKLLHVVAVATPEEAMSAAASGHFDAALVDASLGTAATSLARDLRAMPGHRRIPLAFLSADAGMELRIAAAHAGASLFLTKPIEPYAFGAAIDQMLALGQNERMRVLVVDDDPDFAEVVTAVLGAEGIGVKHSPDARRIVEQLDDFRPDLLLLDAMLPEVDGWDAIRIVRTDPEHRDLPIVFVTGRTDLQSRVAAFDAGADDYLAKPLVPEELLARVRVRLDRRRLMRDMTERDPLTRLLSRRAVLDSLASRLSEARRHSLILSLAILDVDRFKRVNDAYGHLVGDQVLVSLGRLLDARFRLEDLRGRWGGEEFMVVFPGETSGTAAGVLSRVLDEFRAIRFRSESGEPFHVTFSAGIASFPRDGATVDALVRAADRRLYEAKSGGRGVVVAPSAG